MTAKTNPSKKEIFEMKLKHLVMSMMALTLFSCTSMNSAKMVPESAVRDLAPAFAAGQFNSKVDGVVVLLDASSSMAETHEEYVKFDIAKAFVSRMNKTMPPIEAAAGLRTFGHSQTLTKEKTQLFYGMAPYSRNKMGAALAEITPPGGPTPMSVALDAAVQDFSQVSGRKAMIIVSDGKDLGDGPLDAAEELYANVGDSLCVYTVLVGNDEKGKSLMGKMAKVSPCGFMTLAQHTESADSMADYVSNVFLDPNVQTGLGYHKPEPVFKDLGNVHFKFDQAQLTGEGKKILDENIKVLADNPKIKIQIEGHASASGPETYNQTLSEKRAAAVQGYLVNTGRIASDRISAVGYGESRPAVEETDPGMKLSDQARTNMRVEFKTLK